MKKKIVCRALFLSLGLLTTACKSKEDAPRTTEKESTEKVKPSEESKQPEVPNTPEETKPSVPKPSDYHMVTRMQVKVLDGKTTELLRTLDLEEFIWGKKQDAITLKDLLPYVEFYSSTPPGGDFYTLTSDDLQLLELVDLKYERASDYNGNLAFKVRYKGVNGKEVLRIPISMRDYFLQKFELNESFPKEYYLGGLEHQFGIYWASLFKSYDRTKYAIVPTDPRADHSNNTLSFRGVVNLSRYNAENVLTLDFELKGFKPLSALKGQLTFVTTPPLNEYMLGRLQQLQKQKTLTDEHILQMLQPSVDSWIKKASPGIRYTSGGNLHWDGDNLLGELSGGHDTRDIYLARPHFAVLSAHLDKEAATLTLDIELQSANDVALSGVTTKLVVLSVKL